MNIKFYSRKPVFILLILMASAAVSFGQTLNYTPPRQEQLLNQMRLLVWQEPTSPQVTVKLRIHSGSAFDPLGKEGTMQLLADNLFPNTIKDFFEEDLNGKLEVLCNYDYIQINAVGDSDKFLQIMETLSAAITNPQINKENTARVISALQTKVAELEKKPEYLADRAVAKRLFGSYPYGRPQMGNPESLAKIDFADLLLADQKFLTADNATLSINGNVKSDFALKATKRLFGSWLKSDKKTPSTFAQPENPPNTLQILDTPTEKSSEVRFALRGLSRSDKEFYNLQILGSILENRIRAREGNKAFFRQNNTFLPGYVVFGVSDWNLQNIKREGTQISLPVGIETYQAQFLKDAIKTDEFDKSKAKFTADFNQTNVQDFWLDSHTYKFASVKSDLQNFQNVNLADTQKLLEKFQKQAVASVLVLSKQSETNVSTTK